MESQHKYKEICSEDDIGALTFAQDEWIVLLLDRAHVHVTNRALAVIGEAINKRHVHLMVRSPPVPAHEPPIIIQGVWWGPVLGSHTRSLLLDGVSASYAHDVLAAIPHKHAIDRITMRGVASPASYAAQMRAPTVAIERCGMRAADVRLLLAVERPALRRLSLSEPALGADLAAVCGVLRLYASRFLRKARGRALAVDLTCDADATDVRLRSPTLRLTVNGVAAYDDAASEDDAGDDVAAMEQQLEALDKKAASKEKEKGKDKEKEKEKEASEESENEGDTLALPPAETGSEVSKEEEDSEMEASDDPVQSKSESAASEDEDDEIEKEKEKEKKEENEKEDQRERKDKGLRRSFEGMLGGRAARKVNFSDPLVRALAEAARNAALVTCSNCHIPVRRVDASIHKKSYCRGKPLLTPSKQ